VITALRAYPKQVEKIEEVENIYGIGRKMKKKIKEILETGKLKKADALDVKMSHLFLIPRMMNKQK
jgi:DNA polymerase/3'-5' exonuclease PolX